MKKYILLGAAKGIGGWQLYCDARIAYLNEKKIKVYIIYSSVFSDECKIKLSHIKNNIHINIKEFLYPPFVYSKIQIIKIINKIKELIDFSVHDQLCIESTTIMFSLWGEYLSKQFLCDHCIFLLHSHIENVSKHLQDFYWFKYQQKKLAGMSVETLPSLFNGYKTISKEDSNWVSASWESPLYVSDKYDDFIQKIKSFHENVKIIGYFGTLNKPHVPLLFDELINYFNFHKDSSFIFLSIGSSGDGKIEKLQQNIEKQCKNCHSYNIPEQYPVPISLFRIMDVCIASWGSATTAYCAGCMTIRLLNDINVDPQGILGITIKLPYHKSPIVKESLIDLLDDILFKGIYNNITMASPPDYIDFRLKQQKEDDVLLPYYPEKREYYDVLSICEKQKYKYLKMLNSIFGIKITQYLLNIKRKI